MAKTQPDIQIFNETDSTLPLEQSDFTKIASSIAHNEDCTFRFIEVVYVDEQEIIRINKEHLERDYITDIITFRYDDSSDNSAIEGTLFCCTPRIREQAEEFNESPEREFSRILIHGLLHLIGYDDRTETQKIEMTTKEDTYLKVLQL
ncbi:MAG TPA: rRNA maturation RNase YbeY [Balneolaceae bacterium]